LGQSLHTPQIMYYYRQHKLYTQIVENFYRFCAKAFQSGRAKHDISFGT